MSDIIYTPPASGGGTTINPTNNYIPKRSNGTTFVDSVLENGSDYLYTNYGGYTGLGLDFANFVSYLGDWNNLINGTTLVVNDQANEIYTKFNGLVNGFALNFGASSYLFGNTANGNLLIDANNQYAQITLASIQYMALDQLNGIYSFGDYAGGMGLEWDNGNNEFVLKQQGLEYIVVGNSTAYFGQRVNFSYKIDYNTSILSIGDNGGVLYSTLFVVNANAELIFTETGGASRGIYLDFQNTQYKFGDFNAVNKNTYIYIEDGNETIHFRTNTLDFNGAPLQSNTAGGSSGEHLVLTLNGIQYKIQLLNP